MPVELNHTIVPATDKAKSAAFLGHILGIAPGSQWGPFIPLQVAGVTLDYADATDFDTHHYAFLVGESDFDAMFERIQAEGVGYYADPFRKSPGQINHNDGGRGVYFDDPDGHLMELITRPYGG